MSETVEKLRKVVEAMKSNHVSSVEVGFEYEADNIRWYTAITHKGAEQHKYTVRVQDWFNDATNEMERIAKCNCAAGAKDVLCRHIVKVAEVDTERTGKPLFLDDLAKYNGHKVFSIKGARKCKGVNGYKCSGEIFDMGYCSDCLHFLEDQMREDRMAA
jgi:hypothetical protein